MVYLNFAKTSFLRVSHHKQRALEIIGRREKRVSTSLLSMVDASAIMISTYALSNPQVDGLWRTLLDGSRRSGRQGTGHGFRGEDEAPSLRWENKEKINRRLFEKVSSRACRKSWLKAPRGLAHSSKGRPPPDSSWSGIERGGRGAWCRFLVFVYGSSGDALSMFPDIHLSENYPIFNSIEILFYPRSSSFLNTKRP